VICKICGGISEKIFSGKVLQKYDVDYFQCRQCKFIQTEEPYWLQEAYQNSINIEDTGLVERNLLFLKRTSMLLYFLFDRGGKYIDYGGGYGLFTRLMRDYGFDFYWDDPFTQNLFARGYEHSKGITERYELVTSFECFEHFQDPLKELEKMLAFSDSVLFSTEIFVNAAPLPNEWGYYYFSHGQHIALFSIESLEFIAKKYKMNLYTNGKSFHLFTKKSIGNILFKLLLKTALLGVPSLIKLAMGSKTKFDSMHSQEQRKNTH
jgi:hypothetical protein